MAENATIARPYRQGCAFSSRRVNTSALERLNNECWQPPRSVDGAGQEPPLPGGCCRSPKCHAEATLRQWSKDIVGNDLDEQTRNFLAALASNRKLALLQEIASMHEGVAG